MQRTKIRNFQQAYHYVSAMVLFLIRSYFSVHIAG